MVCPIYREEKGCNLHSKFYDLSKETIEKYCKSDYPSCKEFLENNKKTLEETLLGPDFSWLKNILAYESQKKIRGVNDTYTAIATIVKRENSIYIPSEKERLELKCDFSWVNSIQKFNL